MENNIIVREDFDNAKLFLNQLNEFTKNSNYNLELTNQKLQSATDIVDRIGDIYIESKRIDNDNLKLKNELAIIVSEFEIKRGYLQAVFAERSKIIDKHFEVIDKGLRENNDDLVLQGLRGASEFVSTNPLHDFDTFKNILLDKNASLELDF